MNIRKLVRKRLELEAINAFELAAGYIHEVSSKSKMNTLVFFNIKRNMKLIRKFGFEKDLV